MGSNRRLRAAATLALVGAPVYWLQGKAVRRRTPRLPEAPGERSGRIEGGSPGLRLVGVGESPLAAVGLSRQSEAVVPQLAQRLAAATGRRIEWQTAARSGATIGLAIDELLPRIAGGRTDLLILALGVNDCLALTSSRRWRTSLRRLVGLARERLEPERIILSGVPPMSRFPALRRPLSTMLGLRSRLLDESSRRFAEEQAGLVHAPMAFVGAPDDLFCRDGFHPNARAHALWARELAGFSGLA